MSMTAGIDHNIAPEELEPRQPVALYEIVAVIGFVAMLLWGGQHLLNPATLPIKQVRIEGEFKHLSTSVLQELARRHVKGGFFNINVVAIRDGLLAEPWVRDISVHRVWPDGLQIFVTEQVPVARWNNGGFINNEGKLFKPVVAANIEQLPVFAGPAGTETLMLERYEYLYTLLQPLQLTVTALYLDGRRAMSFETDTGLKVIIGRLNAETRLQRFAELVPASLGEKLNDAAIIDMRYPNGFSVRWEDGTVSNQLRDGDTSSW